MLKFFSSFSFHKAYVFCCHLSTASIPHLHLLWWYNSRLCHVAFLLIPQTPWCFFYLRASIRGVLPEIMSSLHSLDNPALLQVLDLASCSRPSSSLSRPSLFFFIIGVFLSSRYFVQFLYLSLFVYHLSSWARVNSLIAETVQLATVYPVPRTVCTE